MILRSQHGSGDRHRAFIAIEVPRRTVPENILEEIGSIGQLRPVRTPSFHLTLHFLGDMEIPALKSVTENISTVKFPPFQASLCGMGAFPRPADARVVFAKIRESGYLDKLHSQIMEAIGKTDDREFIPHVTIARSSGRLDLREFCHRYESFKRDFQVENFFLFLSILTNRGPIYEKVSEISSKGQA